MSGEREIVVGRKNQKFSVLGAVGCGQRSKPMPHKDLADRTRKAAGCGQGAVLGAVKRLDRPDWLNWRTVVDPEDAEALAEWEAERRAIQEADGIFDGPPPTHTHHEWLAELNMLMGRT